MVIFNEKKQKIDQSNPEGTPKYIFEGTWEEFQELKKQEKTILGKNFLIDHKAIVK